jgi:hypothetical protein
LFDGRHTRCDLLDQVSGGAAAAPAVGRLADVARFVGFIGVVLFLGAGLFALIAPPALTTAPATRTLNRNKRKDLTGKMSEKE